MQCKQYNTIRYNTVYNSRISMRHWRDITATASSLSCDFTYVTSKHRVCKPLPQNGFVPVVSVPRRHFHINLGRPLVAATWRSEFIGVGWFHCGTHRNLSNLIKPHCKNMQQLGSFKICFPLLHIEYQRWVLRKPCWVPACRCRWTWPGNMRLDDHHTTETAALPVSKVAPGAPGAPILAPQGLFFWTRGARLQSAVEGCVDAAL